MSHPTGFLATLQRYSLPLIFGVFAALAAANLAPETYHALIDTPLWGSTILGHAPSLHFLINDLFMVLFFGIAAKEITESLLPGGALNPPSKALNPIMGTLGGVLGPIGVFFVLVGLLYDRAAPDFAAIANGWGVPTATDIALAWLAAKLVFGARHPAVNFLLLLAVADDGIGLVIIAVFYPDPAHLPDPTWLLSVLGGMAAALALRKARVQAWLPYVLLGGGLSWLGLIQAHLHPALALVFIVPFLPSVTPAGGSDSTLRRFEHSLKLPVDLGLFFFAFANAGVEFASMGPLTWVILCSLVVGKTLGVFTLSFLASKAGFGLPRGMDYRSLATAGLIAGLGLTVALFVAGEAYPDPTLQGQAKMGALFTGGVFALALIVGKLLRIQKVES